MPESPAAPSRPAVPVTQLGLALAATSDVIALVALWFSELAIGVRVGATVLLLLVLSAVASFYAGRRYE
jgi:hypothetical protein